MWPFNIGDCLIEVSTEASLTVFEIMFMFKFQNEPAVMMRINEWVSERLLCNAKRAVCSAISCQEQNTFRRDNDDDDDVCFVQNQYD